MDKNRHKRRTADSYIILVCLLLASVILHGQNLQNQRGHSVIDTNYFKEQTRLGENIYYSNPDSAKDIWERVLKLNRIFSKSGVRKNNKVSSYLRYNEGELVFNLGSYYHFKNDIIKATKYYLDARVVFEETNERIGLASVYNNLGLIHQVYYKDYDRALRSFYLADSIIQPVVAPDYRSLFLSNIGKVHLLRKNYPLAQQFFESSLKISRENNDYMGIAGVLAQLADYELSRGDLEKANQYITECIDILRNRLDDKRQLNGSLALLGLIKLKEGKTKEAELLGLEALSIAKKIGYPDNIRSAAKLLYQVYEKQKDWKRTFEMLDLYDIMKDSLNNTEKKNEVFRQQVKFEYDKKKHSDSLAYSLNQQQKDLIISKQEISIRKAQNIRNLTIIVACIFLTLGWTLSRRIVYQNRSAQKKLKIEQLETEQKLLRAQMNPHFIFNSLNAIQGLILSNQMAAAKKFLVDFSILMRSVLDHSARDLISVNEEVALLQSYLEMEQLRFRDKLQFSIKKDPVFDEEELFIPPLIIQPFVENAVIHGMQHAEMPGLIKVEINKMNSALECHISANFRIDEALFETGKTEEPLRRVKTAMGLARKRLERIQAETGKSGAIIFSEFKDEMQQIEGTKITIQLQFFHPPSRPNPSPNNQI